MCTAFHLCTYILTLIHEKCDFTDTLIRISLRRELAEVVADLCSFGHESTPTTSA